MAFNCCASEVNHEILAAKTRGTCSRSVDFVSVETSTILTSLLQALAATQQEDSVHRSLPMSCNVNLTGFLHVYEIAHGKVLTHDCDRIKSSTAESGEMHTHSFRVHFEYYYFHSSAG